jgi:hypothetical protein
MVKHNGLEKLKSTHFFDDMLIEHDAIKELDDVNALIDWSEIEDLLSGIHNKARGEKA